MDGELAMNIERGVDVRQRRDDLSRRFEEILLDMDMLRGEVRFWCTKHGTMVPCFEFVPRMASQLIGGYRPVIHVLLLRYFHRR